MTTTLKPGTKAKLHSESSLRGYRAHEGQVVTVLRLDPDHPRDPAYEVKAEDGWIGLAWPHELEILP